MAAPTLYLVGDSTMADWADSAGQEGWGAPAIVQRYFDITVVDRAVSGRSLRSYRREGKWAAVLNLLKPGDFVVVEFGHNDGGSPSTSDRASVVGEGTNTETVTLADGTVEVVQTWTTYMKWYIDEAKAKGATIIVSSQT
ncbi:SGNH hydrolase-type esterase domain-containing protein [Collybia nuda]|uniref:SGNH hydrolase-type esterase domain-containing protein n=1 Tax=Collybia nuda TaxID=64659 RepID=A0A9P6CAS3_9AGAR|nr:SGNH hydrolase-type esterase domain-containing protein [Collybia nuda]